MISAFLSISFVSAFGLVFGRDERVGNSCHPVAKGSLHHLEMVLGSTPNFSDTFLIDQLSHFTSRTASRLTFAMWGFVVYGMYIF